MAKQVMREEKSKPQRHEQGERRVTPYLHELDETISGLVDLQQSIGNRAVQRLMVEQSEDKLSGLNGLSTTRTDRVPGIAQRQEEEELQMKVGGGGKAQRWGPEDEEIQASVMRQKGTKNPKIKPPPALGMHILKGAVGYNFASLRKGVSWCQDAILKMGIKLGMY